MRDKMQTQEKKKNMKAFLYTLLVYVGILGLCFLLGFSSPPPLPNQDMGMVINLGNSAEGTGDIQPLSSSSSAINSSELHEARASLAGEKTGARSEDIMTQTTEDAPVIKDVHDPQKENNFSKDIEDNLRKTDEPQPEAPVPTTESQPQPKAIYGGESDNDASGGNNATANNGSTGEGLTGNTGDQGAVNGDPTASNHNGKYSGLGGNSLSYRLGGRKIVQYPSRRGRFSEAGKVRMGIKVNRTGKVVSYNVISSDNPTIAQLAKKKVKQIRFNSSSSAPVEQFGEIVFVFKIEL
ncbi:MAG TPA: hypothetical protein VK084_05900 [Chitinophagaceae bacterium]|nr:hypothetical protein [Chitinophagaceae bacterium]